MITTESIENFRKKNKMLHEWKAIKNQINDIQNSCTNIAFWAMGLISSSYSVCGARFSVCFGVSQSVFCVHMM